MIRTVARHIAGAIVGLFGTWLMTTLTGLGISPEEAGEAVSNVESLVVVAVMVALYAVTEKGLKLVKPLFPGEWAEEAWKAHAGDTVAPLEAPDARRHIKAGDI